MSNLAEEIDRIEEIKALFTTEYVSFAKPVGRSPIQTTMRTIHKNAEYMSWKAEIEAELDELPQIQLIDDIRKLFKKIDGGWTEEIDFNRLSAKLKALRSRIPANDHAIIQDEESKYQEKDLNKNIRHALINVQKTKRYHGQQEDDINDGVRNALDMVYEVKDQTRQGESESGKKSGELDILLCKDSMPWAIVEALRMPSLNKNNLSVHIDKALTNYDPVGCKNSYVLIYAMSPNFVSLWNNIIEYLKLKEDKFPYPVVNSIVEVQGDYVESKEAYIGLDRNGTMVKLHILAINMS